MSLFSCDHISRYYNSVPTIEQISLRLEKGELVCLLGPSGVGKTTLFHILAGVDSPDSGSVYLHGEEITGRAGKIAYMLQKDLLLPHKTVLENIILPLLIKGVPQKEAENKGILYFPQFGLDGYENSYPKELSGGMRQRAALLRTFLMDKEVILLDEPFSALDPLTRRKMHRWYLDIVQSLSSTTLFITHDLEEALLLSHRIYILAGKPGQIVKEITHLPPWPRDLSFTVSSQFQQLKEEILSVIESYDKP